ncbi:hypothetical protein HMSSN036_88940 [Paenibacillus macerans]|nr:hypothetical protein HMSSN036_88940 [Paenibacillus macerans]
MLKDRKNAAGLTDTLIGQGSSIEGKLECKSNLRLEGKFSGEIECLGQVVIGETGEARSNIQGGEVVVAGKVVGDISTRGKLTITGNGQVDGNVDVAKLIILEGGQLNGSSKMEPPRPPLLPHPRTLRRSEKNRRSRKQGNLRGVPKALEPRVSMKVPACRMPTGTFCFDGQAATSLFLNTNQEIRRNSTTYAASTADEKPSVIPAGPVRPP